MGLKQREWARRSRAQMIIRLGLCCRVCKTLERIEIDCIVPTGDEHHRMCPDQRATFYRGQERIGNVQLLCEKCHAKKTTLDNDSRCSCIECVRAVRNRMIPIHTSIKLDPDLSHNLTRLRSSAEEPF